jgi:hypothetical protein
MQDAIRAEFTDNVENSDNILQALLGQVINLVMTGAILGAVYGVYVIGQNLRVIGSPNEWVLVMRNGNLTNLAIGLSSYRLPFDQVAKFPARANKV